MTINKIGIQWGSVSAGNARVGIYRDNGGTPVGGAVVVQSASIAKSAAFLGQEFAIATTKLTKGLYWIAVESDEATSKFYRCGTAFFDPPAFNATGYYDRGGGYGVLTDPCPAVTASNANVPFAYVIVYSVP
jgi:hypothetical protein